MEIEGGQVPEALQRHLKLSQVVLNRLNRHLVVIPSKSHTESHSGEVIHPLCLDITGIKQDCTFSQIGNSQGS